MSNVVPEGWEANQGQPTEAREGDGPVLDEIVRDGARRMLAAALQAEVDAYIEQFQAEVDEQGRRLVVRNGYHAQRLVTTAAGAVEVRQPRVNDKRVDEATGKRARFASAILPRWARKSAQEVLSNPVDEPSQAACWMAWSEGSGSTSLPSLKVAPARTLATRWGARIARHLFCADCISLNAIAIPAARLPGPFVTR